VVTRVQLILTHQSILMPRSREIMFAIVIFKISRQLLAASPHADTHRGSGLGSRWGTSAPRPPVPPPPVDNF